VPLTSRPVEVTKPVAPHPEPVAKPIDPLPARVLIAPVAASGRDRDRPGDIASDRTAGDVGGGIGGGAGTGQGLGNGSGTGAGIGPGTGGGTGGGPYRPGSGIEPPRLLREVKAVYTDDARRRGLTGDVVLEIVITRDGSVSDVSVTRGLGAGLDERAIAAVRQWRFSPARRGGEAVDVIVEVAVEFSLR
jgi:TonB family protein